MKASIKIMDHLKELVKTSGVGYIDISSDLIEKEFDISEIELIINVAELQTTDGYKVYYFMADEEGKGPQRITSARILGAPDCKLYEEFNTHIKEILDGYQQRADSIYASIFEDYSKAVEFLEILGYTRTDDGWIETENLENHYQWDTKEERWDFNDKDRCWRIYLTEKKEETKMEIKLERAVIRGIPGYLLRGVDGDIPLNKLPIEYEESGNYFHVSHWSNGKASFLRIFEKGKEIYAFLINDYNVESIDPKKPIPGLGGYDRSVFITEKEWDDALAKIKACAERLSVMRKKEAELKAQWSGEIVFVV